MLIVVSSKEDPFLYQYSNGSVTLRKGYVKHTVPKKLPIGRYHIMVSYGGSRDRYYEDEIYRGEFK